MAMRIRSTALMLCAVVLSIVAVTVVPAGEPNSLLAVGAAAILALAVVAACSGRMRPGPVAVHSGPPGSAQQRRRGSFLRQSNPDTAGRVRPRAPGHRS
ncbi:Spy/CpxP family protein refolding chaperone [Nocardia kruczakiae]|uniref:Spy/CpxP family protein refolding chaperone n=1 Tax=Nocardia kruczakiae TaxID=261477 RepID=A0ABU1XN19_9NOCA|nr:DUF6412 domain-containing protein [Nocardia kruczakiae]MDR7171946.1 Spy/CpxP family protein refolding chaperone [Nocardia kruczakiae]